MATTHIAFCDIGFRGPAGTMPVMDGESAVSQGFTPSGTNQQSSAGTKPFVRIATDTAVYIAIGSNPNATTAGTRVWLPANTIEYFQIEIGNKVAVAT